MSSWSSAVSPQRFSEHNRTPVMPLQAQESAEYNLDEPATEMVKPKVFTDTHLPSQSEVEQHEISHIPFRSWCEGCVMGKSHEACFKMVEKGEGCLPCISADYLFVGDKDLEGTTQILSVKDSKSKSVFANVVPKKGAIDFTIDEIVSDIDLLGYTDIMFKTDNEPSMTAIQDAVKRRRPHKTVLENSKRGISQTNGSIENSSKTIAGQIRTMKVALQSRIKGVISRNHVI